jgi:isoquinoline 1-oxidoreductase alpha subunit
MITLDVNGRPRSLDVPDEMPLLWTLRDVLNLTGTKFGCGMGLCGAGTIHIDGRPTQSCMRLVSSAWAIPTASAPPAWQDYGASFDADG